VAKYRNIRTAIDGYNFSSKLEARVYESLKLRVAAGELFDLECQVTVRLTRARLRWVIDFKAKDADGNDLYFEAKGLEFPRWKLLVKLWPYYGPSKLEVWMSAGGDRIMQTLSLGIPHHSSPEEE